MSDRAPAVRVAVACDDPGYREAIAAVVTSAEGLDLAVAGPEGAEGRVVLDRHDVDALILGVGRGEDTRAHAAAYLRVFDGPIVAFASGFAQEQGYRDAGIGIVIDGSATGEGLRIALRNAGAEVG